MDTAIQNSNKPQTDKIAKLIKKLCPFLHDFEFKKFYKDDKTGMNLWVYVKSFPEYTYKIIFGEKKDQWQIKSFVYWKTESQSPTTNTGKDFDFRVGPSHDFMTLIKGFHKIIENNPVIGTHLYEDDFDKNKTEMAFPLLKKLKEVGENLLSIENKHLKQLQNLYKNIKNIPENKLRDYIRIKYKEEADKDDLLFKLQRLHMLDFYGGMKTMGHFK